MRRKTRSTNRGAQHRKERHGIRRILLTGFAVPIILMILLAGVIYSSASGVLEKNYEKMAVSNLEKSRDNMNLVFQGIQAKAVQYVSNTTLIQYYNGDLQDNKMTEARLFSALESDIKNISLSDRYIGNVMVFGAYGKDISNLRNIKNTYDFFKDTPEGKELEATKERGTWIGTHASLDKKYGLDPQDYSMSLIYRMENSRGYLVFDVESSFVTKTLKSLLPEKGGSAAFITADGRMIGSSDSDVSLLKLVADKKRGSGQLKFEGTSYLWVVDSVDSAGGSVIMVIPQAQILAGMDTIRQITIWASIVIVILSLLTGILISLPLSKAVNKITKAMNLISRGDLTVKMKSARKDELGVLAGAMNSMTESFSGLLSETIQVSQNISSASQGIYSEATDILNSSLGVSETVKEIEEGVQIQVKDSEESQACMTDLMEKIDSVNGENQKIRQSADRVRSMTEDGMECIHNLNEKSRETVESTEEILGQIHALQRQTMEINGILNMINDIAEQTNLLSLNASIEAARAGESGKSFAVVAMEIRKLADESVKSSTKIQEIIKGIHDRIELAAAYAKRTSNSMQAHEISISDTTDLFHRIREEMERLAAGIGISADKMVEIATIKTAVMEKIEESALVSRQNLVSAEDIRNIMELQLVSARNMNQSAEHLVMDEKGLRDAVDRFQI